MLYPRYIALSYYIEFQKDSIEKIPSKAELITYFITNKGSRSLFWSCMYICKFFPRDFLGELFLPIICTSLFLQLYFLQLYLSQITELLRKSPFFSFESYNITILRRISNIARTYLINFCTDCDYRCVSASMHLSPFDFAWNWYDYRLSVRFFVHVVREPRLVVSIRDSIVRGSGGSFYFVSAVIFDEGQIATRAFAHRAGRLPKADHLKRKGNGEWEDWDNERQDKRGFHLNGHPYQRTLMRPLHRFASFPPPYTTAHFHPLPPADLLPRLLPKCSNCVLSEPSINIPLNYSVARRPGECSNFFNLIVKSDKSR